MMDRVYLHLMQDNKPDACEDCLDFYKFQRETIKLDKNEESFQNLEQFTIIFTVFCM